MACLEPSSSVSIYGDLLLLCESVTDELLEQVRSLSHRRRVAVAARSGDDSWVRAAFAAGAVGCAVGVADRNDVGAFAALILGFM